MALSYVRQCASVHCEPLVRPSLQTPPLSLICALAIVVSTHYRTHSCLNVAGPLETTSLESSALMISNVLTLSWPLDVEFLHLGDGYALPLFPAGGYISKHALQHCVVYALRLHVIAFTCMRAGLCHRLYNVDLQYALL